jgi:hypothetical protein
MKFKLSIIGWAIIASNLAMAGSLTSDKSQADPFIVTYENNTHHRYTYSNSLPLDSFKDGFANLGNWIGTGQLAYKESITFTGILDKSTESTHWVRFMLKNNDTGQEHVYELEHPAVGVPILHYYAFGQEMRPENLYKQNGYYIINLYLRTHTATQVDVPFLNLHFETLRALYPDNGSGKWCFYWEYFDC